MDIVLKDAKITNTGDDDAFPGSFEVVLSAPTLDRDGDTLLAQDWKLPLPDHITFDQDHGMSVASTVGSGKPRLDDDGRLIVEGTYSSLARAQEVRTLVKERHIRTTSVAFMTTKIADTKAGGKTRTVRELLNGAFVAVPSNRESVVLQAKALSAAVKAGARNSRSDAAHVQAIHDAALALGATPAEPPATDGKALQRRMVAAKAVAGSYEERQRAVSDAIDAAYRETGCEHYVYAYALATFDDEVVFRVSGGDAEQNGQYRADYTYDDTDGTVTLGAAERVQVVEQVVPVKAYAPDDTIGPEELAEQEQSESGPPAAADEAAAAEAAAESAAADLALRAKAFATRAIAAAAG